MTFPGIPFFRSTTSEEASPIHRTVARGDVQWERRLFRAPPLRIEPPVPRRSDFSEVPEGEYANT